jgi:hypothetical protein
MCDKMPCTLAEFHMLILPCGCILRLSAEREIAQLTARLSYARAIARWAYNGYQDCDKPEPLAAFDDDGWEL